MTIISCRWARMDNAQIPAFDKTEDSPLLVLSDNEIIDQTKGSRGILAYFMISAKTPIAVYSRILGCMKILHDEGERRGIKGSFVGVIRDHVKSEKDCYSLIGLGYVTEEVVFEEMPKEQCTELSLPVSITI